MEDRYLELLEEHVMSDFETGIEPYLEEKIEKYTKIYGDINEARENCVYDNIKFSYVYSMDLAEVLEEEGAGKVDPDQLEEDYKEMLEEVVKRYLKKRGVKFRISWELGEHLVIEFFGVRLPSDVRILKRWDSGRGTESDVKHVVEYVLKDRQGNHYYIIDAYVSTIHGNIKEQTAVKITKDLAEEL